MNAQISILETYFKNLKHKKFHYMSFFLITASLTFKENVLL